VKSRWFFATFFELPDEDSLLPTTFFPEQAMIHSYWTTFIELIRTPFEHMPLVWGIVPLYFALLLNEMTSAKANFRTAIQTGFSFLWAGLQWLFPYYKPSLAGKPGLELDAMRPVNELVTFLVLALGVIALISGILRRYPKWGRFLGHTRFSNYFMITIFPIQAQYLTWTWDRLIAIALFAVPIWLILHFGLMPIRNRK
jgi:hypothetical protein